MSPNLHLLLRPHTLAKNIGQTARFYLLIGLRAHSPTKGTKLTTVFDATTSA
jgi:hypothetical protein